MRLIDADAVLDWIKRQEESADRALDVLIAGKTVLTVQSCLNEFERKVKKQPTAFDVEQVVRELRNLKMRYYLTIANTGDADKDCAYLNTANAIDKAIEIVKRGGTDEE